MFQPLTLRCQDSDCLLTLPTEELFSAYLAIPQGRQAVDQAHHVLIMWGWKSSPQEWRIEYNDSNDNFSGPLAPRFWATPLSKMHLSATKVAEDPWPWSLPTAQAMPCASLCFAVLQVLQRKFVGRSFHPLGSSHWWGGAASPPTGPAARREGWSDSWTHEPSPFQDSFGLRDQY